MKYYIDFEAAKYVEEIISVGVVREDGKTFYSLVKPKEGKITNALIELTGLTKEKLNDAQILKKFLKNYMIGFLISQKITFLNFILGVVVM